MKKSWKKKSLPGTAAAFVSAAALVTAALMFSGCEQSTGGSDGSGKVTFLIRFDEDAGEGQQNVLGALRTVYPALTSFTRYTVEFDATTGGEDQGPREVSPEEAEEPVEFELKVGTYTVTVKAYTGTDPDYTEAATGETEGVVVASGANDPVTVQMEPVTGEETANGVFSYAITFPADVTAATLKIDPAAEGAADTDIDLLTLNPTPGTGTTSLAPGYYDVTLSLEKSKSLLTGDSEALHIYPGLTSHWAKEFTDDNFAVDTTIGGQDITITFGTETPIPVENYSGPITIQKGGADVTLTVVGTAGYSDVKWIVDGDTANATTAASITLDPDVYDAKTYNLTVRATKGGIPYARSLQFTVTEEGGGGGGGGPVSAENLAAYLTTLPVGTANTPNVVKLDNTVNVTASTTWETVKAALEDNSKYITLDLSLCTTTSNTISGSSTPTSSHFNYIATDYIVGVTLPNTLVTIGSSSFRNWTSLRTVTIPALVTSIGLNAFHGTTNLESITIPNSVTEIKGGAFQNSGLKSVTIPNLVTSIAAGAFTPLPSLTSVTFESDVIVHGVVSVNGTFEGNLHTVYNAASPKTGTYVKTSGTGADSVWTKQ